MKPYRSYKPTQVDWLGQIPAHWDVLMLKFVFRPKKDKSEDGSEDLLSVLIQKGVVRRQDFLEADSENLSRAESLEGYLKCAKGNLVNNIMKMGFYCLGISEYDGIVSPAYSVFELRDENDVPRYWEYLLKVEKYVAEYRKRSKGIQASRMRLYDDYFLAIHSLYPPVEEQYQIVRYLDSKTAKIDRLIQLKERKIELLKEKRTALINRVLTKGLDPDVKMKDSGVEWIGEIPEHWKYFPIKYVTINDNGIKTGPFGTQLNTKDYVPDGVKVINQKTLIDEDYSLGDEYISEVKFSSLSGFEVIGGDIIMGTRGSFGSSTRTTFGKCSIVPDKLKTSVLHPCLIRIRLDTTQMLKMYFYKYINESSLFLEDIQNTSNSTTIEVIYGTTLKDIHLPVPPIDEQLQLIAYLDEQTSEIDELVQMEQKKIDLLKEYRQSLISEVVTGKIRVYEEDHSVEAKTVETSL